MATPQEEYEIIQVQKKKTSRFFRTALHVHSPASRDFGSAGCNKQLNDRQRLLTEEGKREFLQALAGNLDLVAITDHMICSHAVALSGLSPPRENFAILPGIELSARLEPPLDDFRFHLLAIFPCATAVDEISRIFHSYQDLPGENARNQRTCELQNVEIKKLVEDIHLQKGLCILAHLDSTNSLRFTWHQSGKDILGLVDPSGKISSARLSELSEKFKTLLAGLDVDGVEVSKPDHRKHYSWIQDRDGRRQNIPVLLSLDAHSIEDLGRAEKYCHVKMTEVSFDGLRAALKMPHTRIRFKNDLPTPPSPALLGLSLSSSKGDGFFQNAVIAFSENLNCIIGPRGSGKSTLIDALRYVFGYNKTLRELEQDTGLIKAIKSRQEQNLRDTIVRAFYKRKDGNVHVLEATFDKKSDYGTKLYTLDGHPVGVDDVEKSGEYPLRLFGWSEIETIGRSATHQRELVDRLIPGLPGLVAEREVLREKLKANADELLKIASNLASLFEKNNQIIAHFTEYTGDFNRLNTPEMQEKFASLDLVRRKLRSLEVVIEALDGHLSGLRDLDPSQLTARIEHDIQNFGFDMGEWWRNQTKTALNYDNQIGQAGGTHSQTVSTLNSLREQVASLKDDLVRESNLIEQTIRQLLADNTQAQVEANLRAQAEDRLARATKAREDYLGEYSKFDEKRKQRRELIQRLISKQLEISGKRSTQRQSLVSKLNDFRRAKFEIAVEFKSGGDHGDLLEYLSSKEFLSNRGVHHKHRKWPELLSREFNPCELAEKIWNQESAPLVVEGEFEGQKRSILPDEATELISKRFPFDPHEGASVSFVDKKRLQMLLELEAIPWDDLVQITLNGESVEKKSPGQRSSAMLPLIALSEDTTPLVIDQPEDNLDNRLVGEVISDILARLKERRQVIAATHNPNIVVSGDAEQIIVLEAIGGNRGKVVECGSLDLPCMCGEDGHVIGLLEGGKEAFCVRKVRYDL
jgi:DNA repair ATPase RecN/PHP family Zn ribbon phosphoesterase